VFVAAPPDRVYKYFTDAPAIVRWMGEYAVLDPEPNGQFTVDIRGTPARGHYLELEPPHRLLISWGYAGSDEVPPDTTTLEVRLIAERDGSVHRSRTTSSFGREQQMSALPSAGGSTGSGL
jgi:uncharacterized protein YndB with AHSA1/START domain